MSKYKSRCYDSRATFIGNHGHRNHLIYEIIMNTSIYFKL